MFRALCYVATLRRRESRERGALLRQRAVELSANCSVALLKKAVPRKDMGDNEHGCKCCRQSRERRARSADAAAPQFWRCSRHLDVDVDTRDDRRGRVSLRPWSVRNC